MSGPRIRVGGTTVIVEPVFFIITALLGLNLGTVPRILTWMVVVLVAVLVHELGHAVAFQAFGSKAEVRLYGMGGVTSGAAQPPGRNVIVSLAGPFAGLVLVGVPALYLRHSTTASSSLWSLALDLAVWAAIGWSVLNLMPILPLDGGQVMAQTLQKLFGERGRQASHIVSMVVAGAGGVLAWRTGDGFLAIFALFFVGENYRMLTALRSHDVRRDLWQVYRAIDDGRVDDAAELAVAIQRAKVPAAMRPATVEATAWATVARGGDGDDIRSVLRHLPQNVAPPPALLAAARLADGARDEALALAATAYSTRPTWPPSVVLARRLADAGLSMAVVERVLETARADADADPGRRVVGLAFFQAQLHHAGCFTDAVHVGERLFDASPDPLNAFNVACSYARLDEPDRALAWLRRAVDGGFSDLDMVDSDPDLAGLRGDRRFEALAAEVRARRPATT